MCVAHPAQWVAHAQEEVNALLMTAGPCSALQGAFETSFRFKSSLA